MIGQVVFLDWDYEIVRTMVKGKVCHERKLHTQNMVDFYDMNGIFVKYDLDNVMLSLSLHLCVNFSEKDFCSM